MPHDPSSRAAAAQVWLRRAGRGALDAVWPDSCAGCGRLGAALCADCLRAAPRLGSPRCAVCAGPPSDPPSADGRCVACRGAAYRWVVAAVPYVDPWRRWVHAAKFRPDPALARALAAPLAAAVADEELGPGWLLVPVPPSNRTSVVRGPNLAASLAREAGAMLGLDWRPLVARRRPGRAQRRGGARRRAALDASAFAVESLPRGVRGVVLVDDVMTTGATLAATAQALAVRWPGLALAAAVLGRAAAPAEAPFAP